MDRRFVECLDWRCVGGERITFAGWIGHEYVEQGERCPHCNGTGVTEIEVEPITLEDLDAS